MNTNNIALRAAVVIALGTVTTVASAVVYAPGTPVILAAEQVITSTTGKIKFDGNYVINIDMSEFAGRDISAGSPLEVKITLTNGATFTDTTAASFGCAYTGAGGLTTPALPTTAAESMLNGQAGESIATFKMKGGTFTAAAAEAYCKFSGGIVLTSGSKEGNASYEMTVSAYLKSQAGIADDEIKKTVAGSVLAFKQAYAITMTPGQTTIDVADPSFSQKFKGTGDGKSAVLGTIEYKVTNADYANKLDTTNGTITQIGTLGDVLQGNTTFTLSGTPLMAAGGGTSVFVAWGATDAAACDAAAAAAKKRTPTSAGVVTFDDVAAADMGKQVFCYVVDGSTRVDKGIVTVDITTPTDASKRPNVSVVGDKTLSTFYKNGTSVKVLTIPDPTDGNNELNVRIYNMSSSKIKVYGTLYKMDGTVLGKNVVLGDIDGNAIKVLKSGGPAPANMGLASLFGVTTWGGGRAWLQIEGDSQQLRVQALAKTAGILVNMSDRVIEDSGAFYRSDAPWELKN